jgi:hypothetical protein
MPCRRQGGEEVYLLLILDLGSDGVSGQRQRPAAYCPWGKTPGTHWIGPG